MNRNPATLREALNIAERPDVSVHCGEVIDGIGVITISGQISALAVALREMALAQGVDLDHPIKENVRR